MPHISVKLYKGKTDDQKRDLAAAITKSVIEILQSADRTISITIEDFEPAVWPEQVYKPEILEKPTLVYKKPGYNPFE